MGIGELVYFNCIIEFDCLNWLSIFLYAAISLAENTF